MKHSSIGASGAQRWMNCPGSVNLSRGMESATSEHAAEGTVAHWVGESALREELPAKAFVGETREQDGFVFVVDEAMAEAVQVYLASIRKTLDENPESELFIERSFHLKQLHPDAFGTADAIIWAPKTKTLYVDDYKHGQGVAVEVEGNVQGLYNALGALLETGFPAKRIVVRITQPRCPHPDGPVRSWEVGVMELLEWMGELEEAMHATEDPNAPLNPGSWCRWCPAAAICPKLKETAQEAAKSEFGEGLSYDPDELAENLRLVPVLENWCKSVREFAYNEAEKGAPPPGHKLVEKRAQRKWRDEEAAEQYLLAYGLDEEQVYKPKAIKTPAQIEKVLGKASKEDIADLVIKESSGHTLVPADDKRPAIKVSAAEDFADPLS